MAFPVQRHAWKTNTAGGKGKALLLVHGIGNSKPGDYDFLLPKLQAALGPEFGDSAVYSLYYDVLNDWVKDKIQAEAAAAKVAGVLSPKFGGALGAGLAEYAGDVLWPILSASARQAIQSAYLKQLQGMVLDGIAAGFPPEVQNLSILCHSLGCFHTYEVLHACVKDPSQKLHPAKDGVRFANVVYMASPAQLIRSVAGSISALVPKGLAVLNPQGLRCPIGISASGRRVPSVKRWVSITGSLDPVGGHLLGKKMDWAYMNVPADAPFTGQTSLIDPQTWIQASNEAELKTVLAEALATRKLGQIPIRDPHSWGEYITGHAGDLRQWLVA